MNQQDLILILNSGSSSIKLAIYHHHSLDLIVEAQLSNITTHDQFSTFKISRAQDDSLLANNARTQLKIHDQQAAIQYIQNWLEKQGFLKRLCAIGHRVVHGGNKFCDTTRVNQNVLNELRTIISDDPVHLPAEISIAQIMFDTLGNNIPHLLCFDTSFHKTMPASARTYGLPRTIRDMGVQRFGFHGLSYQYILQRLNQLDPIDTQTNRKTVIAHLGSGASMCAAIRDHSGGQSVDTTMGFTPTGGLVMSTRTGDIDPGVWSYLSVFKGLSSRDLEEIANQQGGLLGISNQTGDMKTLLENAAQNDPDCRLAVDVFVHNARRWLGAMIASLNGIDELIFTGGIGEKSVEVRSRIAQGFEYLGVMLDDEQNQQATEGVISVADGRSEEHSPLCVEEDAARKKLCDRSRVRVWVIPTDEQVTIAREVQKVLKNKGH